MWLKKYKSDSAVINKIKMLKTFNSLGLNILAPGYSSHFFIIGSENFTLMKHLQHFTLKKMRNSYICVTPKNHRLMFGLSHENIKNHCLQKK